MKKLILLVITFILVQSSFAAEYYFKFNISKKAEISYLTKIISIDNVDSLTVYAYANDEEWANFKKLNYDYELLTNPSYLQIPAMAEGLTGLADWDTYPTYPQYDSMMTQFALDYPNLCILDTIGLTPAGHYLLYVKISDNVALEENEPEVNYTSSMHGDEVTGYVLMLRLIDYLLSNYGTDPEVTLMVDNMEIWINPCANPDGTYAGGDNTVYGATRYNLLATDLNRNFPDPKGGDHPDGKPWMPETISMMDFAAEHSFVLSTNFHGGIEVVNYPWDTWIRDHADVSWYYDISRRYADTAQHYSVSGYMDALDNGITNGYDWYEVEGGRQDYMLYWHKCREVTIELSNVKTVSSSMLPAYWNYNRDALLDYLENALYGIKGLVTDYDSGDPLTAMVTVLNHDLDSSQVRTDPEVGDYHRMIASGMYDLQFTADGYFPHTEYGVEAVDFSSTILDVALLSKTNYDTDNDNIIDTLDNCIGVYNPDQADPDLDSVGTLCDNCADIYNPEQVDTDGDGIGDLCEKLCGDIIEDGLVDVSDLVFLVDYQFRSGPAPDDPWTADIDGEPGIDVGDLVYMVDYQFRSGSAPICQ